MYSTITLCEYCAPHDIHVEHIQYSTCPNHLVVQRTTYSAHHRGPGARLRTTRRHNQCQRAFVRCPMRHFPSFALLFPSEFDADKQRRWNSGDGTTLIIDGVHTRSVVPSRLCRTLEESTPRARAQSGPILYRIVRHTLCPAECVLTSCLVAAFQVK